MEFYITDVAKQSFFIVANFVTETQGHNFENALGNCGAVSGEVDDCAEPHYISSFQCEYMGMDSLAATDERFSKPQGPMLDISSCVINYANITVNCMADILKSMACVEFDIYHYNGRPPHDLQKAKRRTIKYK